MLKKLYDELKKRKIYYVQILESHNKRTRKFWKRMKYKETRAFIWAEKRIK